MVENVFETGLKQTKKYVFHYHERLRVFISFVQKPFIVNLSMKLGIILNLRPLKHSLSLLFDFSRRIFDCFEKIFPRLEGEGWSSLIPICKSYVSIYFNQ